MEKYGAKTPPQVDLGKATPPQAIYVAQGNDYLVQPEDYNRLVAELPHVVRLHIVDYEEWNHIDFLVARDAPRLLYPHIFDEMSKHR